MLRPSLLLSTLEQLDDSAWLTCLLPKIKQDKQSLCNFALTCKQLRQLCHQGQERLCLGEKECAGADLDSLPLHFPACSHVIYSIKSTEGAIGMSSVLPVLARMPALSQLGLRATSPKASHPAVMALIIDLARLQLTAVTDLEVEVCSSWKSSSQVWRVLGRATHLKKLALDFYDCTTPPVTMKHLTGLKPLGASLQSLIVLCSEMKPLQDYSFLSHLTSLTSLSLSLASTQGLAGGIRGLLQLRSLNLCAMNQPEADRPGIGQEADCEVCSALKQLVMLTELRMAHVNGVGSSPAFLSALQCMPQLQVLGAHEFTPEALPVLAGLTKLEDLGGVWPEVTANEVKLVLNTAAVAAAAAAPGAAAATGPARHTRAASSAAAAGSSSISVATQQPHFPSLRQLGSAGHIPFHVLGANLRVVCQWQPWLPATFRGLAQHCPCLKELLLGTGMQGTMPDTFRSLALGVPVQERMAAISSLSGLKQLTKLQFAAAYDEELAVLARLSQLRSVHLAGFAGGVTNRSVTVMGLMQLLLLRGLQELELEFYGLRHEMVNIAQTFIASMHWIKRVVVFGDTFTTMMLRAGAGAARAAGLTVPEELVMVDYDVGGVEVQDDEQDDEGSDDE